jgi:hypothetical protein
MHIYAEASAVSPESRIFLETSRMPSAVPVR